MNGYSIVVGYCFGCGRPFGFNPYHVPSIPIDGEREPICRDCIERANAVRAEHGIEPFVIHADAYEPIEGMP